jgi:hypothetical protein
VRRYWSPREVTERSGAPLSLYPAFLKCDHLFEEEEEGYHLDQEKDWEGRR